MLPVHTASAFLVVLSAVPAAFAAQVPAYDLKPERAHHAPSAEQTARARAQVAGQSGAAQLAQAPAIDFSRIWIDEPGDGRTWVRGRTYKASFDAECATYIPFLGSDAPRNFPVRVELAGATAGGTVIPLAEGTVSHSADSVTIDRGAIREVWHLSPDSAEQTFEIAQRPVPTGDVSLRMAIESELALRADGAGFALEGEHGGVHIGRATAVDADGRRLDLTSRVEGAAIAIDVPADFVASARFPLVVDPLYTTQAPDGFGYQTGGIDVAAGGPGGLIVISYGIAFSQSDADMFTQDTLYGSPIAGSGDWVDTTTDSWYDPQVAYNGDQDTFLTVVTVQNAAAGAFSIRCRARRAQAANEFPQQLVQNDAGGDVLWHDVGGDPTIAAPSYFLAVWTRIYSPSDQDIHAQLLDPFGVRVGGVIFIENSGEHDSFPHISESVGANSDLYQDWNITWQRNNAGDYNVWGARVHWNGVVTTPAFGIAQSFLVGELLTSPSTCLDTAGAAPNWMVAYVRDGNDTDVFVRVMNGASTIATANLSQLTGAPAGAMQTQPRVDSDGRRFVVTHTEIAQPNGNADAFASTLAWADGALRVDEAREPIETGPDDPYIVEIAGGHNFTNPGYGFFGLGWTHIELPQSAVYCGSYYVPPTYESFCSGDGSYGACPCDNTGDPGAGCASSVSGGGLLTPDGQSSVSYDTFSLVASELPGSSTCLFFQGTSDSPEGTAFGDGLRCAGGTVIRIASKTASGGIATYPEPGDEAISVRGSIPASGTQRRYQVWYRNAASYCTPSPFNTTNGVRVRWLL